MPPGINDVALDVIKLIKKIEFIMVGNQSRLTLETLKKIILMSKESGKKVLGIIDNMRFAGNEEGENKFVPPGVPFLGEIRFDNEYEVSLGNINKLLKTQFAENLRNIISNSPGVF
jgi:ATP-binding protein involved in chromosome partitioning